jgi:hypothetical protein
MVARDYERSCDRPERLAYSSPKLPLAMTNSVNNPMQGAQEASAQNGVTRRNLHELNSLHLAGRNGPWDAYFSREVLCGITAWDGAAENG